MNQSICSSILKFDILYLILPLDKSLLTVGRRERAPFFCTCFRSGFILDERCRKLSYNETASCCYCFKLCTCDCQYHKDIVKGNGEEREENKRTHYVLIHFCKWFLCEMLNKPFSFSASFLHFEAGIIITSYSLRFCSTSFTSILMGLRSASGRC